MNLCSFVNCFTKEKKTTSKGAVYDIRVRNSIFVHSKAVSKLELIHIKGSDYLVKAYKANGKPAKGIKLTLKIINKKTKTLKTNSKGMAKFRAV